jgi:Bax protein
MNSITKKISIMSVLALMIVLVVYQFMGQEEPSVLLMGQENLAVTSIQEDLSLPRIEAKPLKMLSKLPDFAKIADVKQKKEVFFTTLYPLIEEENKHVLKIRNAIVALQEIPFIELQPQHLDWISETAKYYRVENQTINENTLGRLLKRVDIIPPSLALSQAAIESGWGSSRFSKKGNNLFGQWCFSKGCGMVPSARESGKAHEVAMFASVNEAVRAYIKNLNTNSSFQKLRDKRASIRKQNGEMTGIALAQTLIEYSAEREKYISKVAKFINQNKLQRFSQQFNESLVEDTKS